MDYLLLFALPVSVLLVVLPVFVSWIYDGREDMVVMVMLAVMVWLPMADRRAQETLLELRPIGH